MMPTVTVLMSVYNGERWLSESIQSILNQTFSDFEFIIVNDGSTDRSLKIINHHAEKSSHIRVYDKPNTGLADSLNFGIENARGEWIARIDADDLCMPKRLEKQIGLVRSSAEFVLVGTGLVLIDGNGIKYKEHRYPTRHNALLCRLSRGGNFFAHSSALFKTSIVRKLGGYRPRIHRSQDRDLWLRMADWGIIGCIKDPLVQIRKHLQQISHDEGGQRQIVDSHVAMTSYWLRMLDKVDPVKIYSDKEFEQFRNWVSLRLQENMVFSGKLFVENIKLSVKTSVSCRSKVCTFVQNIQDHPYLAWRWLLHRYLGSSISKKLANEWSKSL
jgi:glycosyltransferase involved in cell wall biosynthesis